MSEKPTWWLATAEIDGKRWVMSIPASSEEKAQALLELSLKEAEAAGKKVKLVGLKQEPGA